MSKVNLAVTSPSRLMLKEIARQLAKIPNFVKASDEIMDLPDDADIYETKLRDGDLIIAYGEQL